ncbi:hypothetical protein A2Y85_07695 [candidate division WOR-3 bacterium RBG_13_43_14]|uniref:PorV/PorQ family protein n=1 Tax=candidate division WOR-3 bacterium RBG_13_43_14 TaxID=1802590 RepID=A0A1F4UEN8_UNCW3|nr:MAG: hypothetical protein A2Y85_07695 [candidate division WOR-3 bacterium RBG_13_43_14]
MRVILIILSTLFISFGFCFTKVGTTAAPFLKIEFGARPVAMAGSFVALADDPSGIYYNPAGIAEIDRVYVLGGHTVWFADLDYNYATFILPAKKFNFALWGSFLSTQIDVTTIENPEGTGQTCNYVDGLLGFTMSAFLSDRLSIGLSGKYIQQTLYHESASTFAVDVGSILRTPFQGLRLGMCMVNYGGRMQLSGNDLIVQTNPWSDFEGTPDVEARLTTESFPLPLAFKLGIAWNIIDADEGLFVNNIHSLTLAVDGIHPNDGKEKLQIGCEYGMFNTLFLRGGYKINYDVQKFCAGAGIKIAIGAREILVDYAYVNMDILDSTHRISLAIGF